MSIALVTGSAGLVGAACVKRLAREGLDILGIDNDTRRILFGDGASTEAVRKDLEQLPGYRHLSIDIRDHDRIEAVLKEHGQALSAVIHAAAQPSHDWAADHPLPDFSINATASLSLLEATRRYAPETPFALLSTNKVYGDTPNRLPLIERETRLELDPTHHWAERGIDESMSIDGSLHSLFGVSKASADLLAQEYGRYFGLPTGVFRAGCITGPDHAAAELHGFLAYLVRSVLSAHSYTIIGYGGKQVRDNIHADDVAEAIWRFIQAPRCGVVFNVGGGREGSCSVLEAIEAVKHLTGIQPDVQQTPGSRRGDHRWWITDSSRLQTAYPGWFPTRTVRDLIGELCDVGRSRWT